MKRTLAACMLLILAGIPSAEPMADAKAVIVSVDRRQNRTLTLSTSSGRLRSVQRRSPSMAGVQSFDIPDVAHGSVLVGRIHGSVSGVVSQRIVVK